MNRKQVIEDIKYGRIYSSTLTVYTALSAIQDLCDTSSSLNSLRKEFTAFVKEVIKARPTSAMLQNSLKEVAIIILKNLKEGRELEETRKAVKKKIMDIMRTYDENNKQASLIASRRLSDGDTVLTVSYSKLVYETFKMAADEGKNLRVIALESRPGSEGVKLAEEISELGFKVTLIVDSAARFIMKEVDKVLVGSEALAANGALINKVGTSLVALSAHEARVRLFTLAPTHKISHETFLGELVELMEADPASLYHVPEKFKNTIKVWAPLFDVTPPEYIDAIITEKGLLAPQAIPLVVAETYGWPPKIQTLDSVLEELEKYGDDDF